MSRKTALLKAYLLQQNAAQDPNSPWGHLPGQIGIGQGAVDDTVSKLDLAGTHVGPFGTTFGPLFGDQAFSTLLGKGAAAGAATGVGAGNALAGGSVLPPDMKHGVPGVPDPVDGHAVPVQGQPVDWSHAFDAAQVPPGHAPLPPQHAPTPVQGPVSDPSTGTGAASGSQAQEAQAGQPQGGQVQAGQSQSAQAGDAVQQGAQAQASPVDAAAGQPSDGPLPPGFAIPGGVPGGDGGAGMKVDAFAAGYNPTVDTGQWNIAKLFGSAATAQSMLAKYNGQGVHVGMYDDGIDKTNSALMTHYDASRELVINGAKADPGILGGAGMGVHGTATAGIVGADASKTNGQVTGIAYGAGLTSVNVFNGAASGSGMLPAIKQMSTFDVTNSSLGWTSKWADLNSGSYSFGGQLVQNLAYAGQMGRNGLGTVMVKSAGNDWLTDHRDAATQQWNTDRHVIVVGAVGDNDSVAYYSQRGASVLTSGPSNGYSKGITTTDKTGAAGYSSGDTTNTFGGTSAAAPEVTAVVADMLSANSKLGARDVQNILALASHDNETANFTTAATGNMAYGWTVNKAAGSFNGGGYHFSNDEGFGELNAHDAIRLAGVWSYMNPVSQTYNNEVHLQATSAGKAIPTTANGAAFSFNVSGNEIVENANVTLNVSTANLDHLKVVLYSPGGTQSIVLDTSTTTQGETGNGATGGVNLTLSSHAFLGEKAAGTWTAQVIDTTTGDNAKVNSATLDLYGSTPTASHQFHYTDEAAKMIAADPSRLVLSDKGGVGSWIDTAMMTGSETIDLRSGQTSYQNGKAFVQIAADTTINKVTLGDGACTVRCNDNGDTVVMGAGSATVTGGNGADTFIAGSGTAIVTGGAGNDVFKFDHTGFGSETITDFTKGADKIDMRGLGLSFSALKITDDGSKITIGNIDAQGDSIVLTNTHGQHLAASDFLFA